MFLFVSIPMIEERHKQRRPDYDGRFTMFEERVIDALVTFTNPIVIDFDGDGDLDIIGSVLNGRSYAERSSWMEDPPATKRSSPAKITSPIQTAP